MEWKVSKEKIEVFKHYNSDNLSIGKVGTYQVVFNTEQGGYKTGDAVVFIPEKSILPDNLKIHWESFLKGSDKNRVGSVRLRGELSQGILLKESEAKKIMGEIIDTFEIGSDISQALNIKKYEPPIPVSLMGTVKPFNNLPFFRKHDCEHFSTNIDFISLPVNIIVTEKLHGSQVSIYVNKNKEVTLTSKGLANRGVSIIEDETNTYWKALKNTLNIDSFPYTHDFQIFGEVIPVQKGYSYGQEKPILKIFRYLENGKDVPFNLMPKVVQKNFVPIIFQGNIEHREHLKVFLRNLAEGNEQVSGKELHIREGVVVSSLDREYNFQLKIINTKYKETGEEIN